MRAPESPQDPVGCRWITGDVPGAWRYCQKPTAEPNGSWCREHVGRVFQPVKKTEVPATVEG